jgi:hypothetical protein
VEKVAWLWGLLLIHGFHQLLDDEERRKSSDAAAIEAEEPQRRFSSMLVGCHVGRFVSNRGKGLGTPTMPYRGEDIGAVLNMSIQS